MNELGNQATKGQLDVMLLSLLEDGPLHGYALIQRLRQRSGGLFEMQEGTLYPALHRLERDGELVSNWTVHDGRRRRLYALSTAGKAALEARAAEWQQFSRAVDEVLGTNSTEAFA